MTLLPRLVVISNGTGQVQKVTTVLVPITAQGAKLVISNVILSLLVSVWTYMRFWSRKARDIQYSTEEWLLLASSVFFCGYVAANLTGVFAGGVGHHLDELQDWHIVSLSKVMAIWRPVFMHFCTKVPANVVIGCIRWTIYVRLFHGACQTQHHPVACTHLCGPPFLQNRRNLYINILCSVDASDNPGWDCHLPTN